MNDFNDNYPKQRIGVVVKEPPRSENLSELLCTKSQTGDVERPPTPIGWSETDWIKYLKEI